LGVQESDLRALLKHGVIEKSSITVTQYAISLQLRIFTFIAKDKLDDWVIVAL